MYNGVMSNAAVIEAARYVANADKRNADDSAATRISARAAALSITEATRAAAYPLGFLLDTGRLSTEHEAALLGLSARRFASAAIDIAAKHQNVNESAEAWRAVARKAA